MGLHFFVVIRCCLVSGYHSTNLYNYRRRDYNLTITCSLVIIRFHNSSIIILIFYSTADDGAIDPSTIDPCTR